MKVVFETGFYSLSFDPAQMLLLQQWRDCCSSEDFRATHTKSLNFFIENKCKHLVTDVRFAPPLLPEDAQWAAEVILARYRQAGLEQLCVVRPLAAQTQQIVDNLGRGGMRVVVFDSLEEALRGF